MPLVTRLVCGGARIGASSARWFHFCQTLMQAVGQGVGILERRVKGRQKVKLKKKEEENEEEEEEIYLSLDHRGKEEAWGSRELLRKETGTSNQ